jgi:hypothetical protein
MTQLSLWECARRIAPEEGVSPEEALIRILGGIQLGEIPANRPDHISAGLISWDIQKMIGVIALYQAYGIPLSLDSSELARAHEMTAEIDQITDWWRGPVRGPVRLPEETVKKHQFLEWAETEKDEHGSYPRLQSTQKGRVTVRQWATKNGVRRDIAEEWVKEAGWARPRGRPSLN